MDDASGQTPYCFPALRLQKTLVYGRDLVVGLGDQ